VINPGSFRARRRFRNHRAARRIASSAGARAPALSSCRTACRRDRTITSGTASLYWHVAAALSMVRLQSSSRNCGGTPPNPANTRHWTCTGTLIVPPFGFRTQRCRSMACASQEPSSHLLLFAPVDGGRSCTNTEVGDCTFDEAFADAHALTRRTGRYRVSKRLVLGEAVVAKPSPAAARHFNDVGRSAAMASATRYPCNGRESSQACGCGSAGSRRKVSWG
jgi:hypothetical protein